jgi:hypothetical protein
MDTVSVLRDLWRHRILVAGVAVVALLAGFAVLYKLPSLEPRSYQVGVATARILVDTPSSQVVEIAPKGSESLGVRANLLASLMVDGVVKAAIAERAGLRPDELVGISTSVSEPQAAPPRNRRAHVLTTRVATDNDGAQLPIIEIEAQAADVATAAKLADAARKGLGDYLDSKAAAQRIPDAERLQVSGLGAPQAEMAARGPKAVFAAFAAFFVFGVGAACIIVFFALVRAWRTASAQEAATRYYVPDEVWDDVSGDPARAPARDDWSDDWISPASPALVAVPPPGDGDEPQAQSA